MRELDDNNTGVELERWAWNRLMWGLKWCFLLPIKVIIWILLIPFMAVYVIIGGDKRMEQAKREFIKGYEDAQWTDVEIE